MNDAVFSASMVAPRARMSSWISPSSSREMRRSRSRLSLSILASGAQQAAEDHVLAVIEAAFVQGQHAVPLVDQAERVPGAVLVLADVTGIGGRKAAAARTQVQIVPQVVDALAQAPGLGLGPLEQGHGHAHGRLGAKPGAGAPAVPPGRAAVRESGCAWPRTRREGGCRRRWRSSRGPGSRGRCGRLH